MGKYKIRTMKFFAASLLAAAIEASNNYGHHGAHIVSRVVPRTHIVTEARHGHVDVPVTVHKTVPVHRTVAEHVNYSDDSGDGYNSDHYSQTSQSSVSGSTHKHGSDSYSDLYSSHSYSDSTVVLPAIYGHDYTTDTDSSSSDCHYGYGCQTDSLYDSQSSYSNHHGGYLAGHHGKRHHGIHGIHGRRHGGYGRHHGGHYGYTSHSSSSSVSTASDHTHYGVHSVDSISADSSNDNHVIHRTVTDHVTVPETVIVQKPVTTLHKRAVTVLERQSAVVHHGGHHNGHHHGRRNVHHGGHRNVHHGGLHNGHHNRHH